MSVSGTSKNTGSTIRGGDTATMVNSMNDKVETKGKVEMDQKVATNDIYSGFNEPPPGIAPFKVDLGCDVYTPLWHPSSVTQVSRRRTPEALEEIDDMIEDIIFEEAGYNVEDSRSQVTASCMALVIENHTTSSEHQHVLDFE